MKIKWAAMVVPLMGVGCMTIPKPGFSLASPVSQSPSGGATGAAGSPSVPNSSADSVGRADLTAIGAQVAFDHGCAQKRVRLIRYHSHIGRLTALDLDVCGAVRRYKMLGGIAVDVTALYPATSLPGPLPPEEQPGE